MTKLAVVALAAGFACLSGISPSLAKPGQGGSDSNRSCVAEATLAFKNKELRGNNGNGVAVREQARSGQRGELVRALAQSCKGNNR